MSIDAGLKSLDTPLRPHWLSSRAAAAEALDDDSFLPVDEQGNVGFAAWTGGAGDDAAELADEDYFPLDEAGEVGFSAWAGTDGEADFPSDDDWETAEPFLVAGAPIDDVILLDVDEADELLGEQAARRISWPAVIAAAVLHVWLILTLAGITQPRPEWVYDDFIDSRMDRLEVPEKVEQVVYDLAVPSDKDLPVREVLSAASVGQSLTKNPQVESAPSELTDVMRDEKRTRMYDIPEGTELDDRLVVKGTLGDSVLQMETALDRVTWEIARNMQESKVLVVWMLDASGSLKTQREIIASRLERIYGELGALADIGQIPRKRKPLISGVVTYGERTNFLTREPTDKFEEIREAIANVQPDPSGQENVFTAVYQTMQLWKGYRASNGRRIMLIVVTDESGDDFNAHTEAIGLCQKYGALAYVIGPTAVLGRKKGYVPYVAPEDGRTYQLEVDLGPETAMFDLVDLPYWYDGPQYRYLSSGFGPYALSRLVSETGGVYFTTNMTTMQGLSPVGYFDPQAMKPFQPDYSFGTIEQYAADLAKHPLRYAVVQAARISRENQAEGTPQLTLRVTGDNFRQAATNAQQTVAKSQLMIENILAAFPENVDQLYEQEPSERWRLAFNLSYGRLLANRVRCYEYNMALAELKGGLTPDDVNRRANRWVFRPSSEVNYATNFKGQAKKAEAYLKRVVDAAPGTPWAVLASRELQNAAGVRVVQQYVPPPVQRPAAERPNNNPRTVLLIANDQQRQPRPQPPPKQKQVVLPKL